MEKNKFELIFDELVEGYELKTLLNCNSNKSISILKSKY